MNVLAFNRPQYLEKVLSSLRDQTISLDNNLTTFWIDGFQGSRDEHRWHRNRTQVVSKLAKEYFPEARFVIRDKNHGIAMQYREAEAYSFSLNTDVAFFFEEDLVLSRYYLEALIDLEEKTRSFPQIGRFAVHGYIREAQDSLGAHQINEAGVTWGFGLRRRQYEALLPLMSQYYDLIAGDSYWKRNHEAIRKMMLSHGIYQQATSQDRIKSSFARKLGFLGISTRSQLGQYIGRTGEHKTYLTSLTRRRGLFGRAFDESWGVQSQDVEDFLQNYTQQ